VPSNPNSPWRGMHPMGRKGEWNPEGEGGACENLTLSEA
jgi:hypothetical protein